MKAGGAYLLAAGRGRRAGGPKAWLDDGGAPLLEKQLVFLLGRFPAGSIGVAIQSGWNERCRALGPGVNWIAADPDDPPMASLLALLRRAPIPGWAFLHHVDMPIRDPELFSAIESCIPEAERDGAYAVVPTHGGRRGHPVLLSPGARTKLLALDPAQDRLDAWLRERKVLTVETPHACVLENCNL